MVLPEEFVVPPLGHLLAILLGVGLVGAGLWRRRPPVTQWTPVALAPWMALGGGLHVVWVLGVGPTWLHPVLGAPAVYLTTAVLAGAVWLAAAVGMDRRTSVDRTLGAVGATALLGVAGVLFWTALGGSGVALFWPAVGVVLTFVLTAAVWYGFRHVDPETARLAGWAGAVVVFGHVLDGVTTAIGMDVLGTGERSPLPRMLMGAAGALPTADIIGVGWAFVLVKVVLATVVVWLFREYVREIPSRGFLLLALFAAVGLGPGTHNLLLFLHAG